MGQKYTLHIFDNHYKYYISDGITIKYLTSFGWRISVVPIFMLRGGGLEISISESQYNQLLACNSDNIDSFIMKNFPEVEL